MKIEVRIKYFPSLSSLRTYVTFEYRRCKLGVDVLLYASASLIHDLLDSLDYFAKKELSSKMNRA